MSTISSISASQTGGANSALQAAVQQAKRTANQAEQTAQTLESQAATAQTDATTAQDYANTLNIQASQAQLNVGWTQQGLNAVEVAGQIDNEVPNIVTNLINVQAGKTASISVPATPPPVVNTSGQITGKIINTSA